MTTQELTEIKAAAQKIHAAAVAAGKWDPQPEWEAKLMDIIGDIAKAVERDKRKSYADLSMFDFYVPKTFDHKEPGEPFGTFESCFESFVQGTVEDCLADAVIDILDTVQADDPECFDHAIRTGDYPRGRSEETWQELMGGRIFAEAAYFMVGELYRSPALWFRLLCVLQWIKEWAEHHGIDLRRHVELKMKYNEARR